ARRLLLRFDTPDPRSTSVLDGQTFDVVTLEIVARGFCLVLIEPGEAGAIEGLFAFDHRFGKRVGGAQDAAGLALDIGDALRGLVLGRIGADLDDPAAARLRLWLRRRGHGRSRG